MNDTPVSLLTPEELIEFPGFRLGLNPDPSGRIEIFEEPIDGHVYAAGGDPALGIEGRDFDALVIADCSVDPITQVAEIHGHWGPDIFDRVCYAACASYKRAFLVLEGQGGGLSVARKLWTRYRYRHLYRRRDEKSAGRRVVDVLGYWRMGDDQTLWNLRESLRAKEYLIRSKTSIDQLSRMQFYSERDTDNVKAGDSTTKIRLKGGGSPDLVRAHEYCWHAVKERGKFRDEAGDGFDGDDVFGDKDLMRKERRRERGVRRVR